MGPEAASKSTAPERNLIIPNEICFAWILMQPELQEYPDTIPRFGKMWETAVNYSPHPQFREDSQFSAERHAFIPLLH
jgi:hypothetical protein